MNINNWSPMKKLLVVVGVILIIVGVATTIFIVQRRQDARTGAQASTTLSFSPGVQNVAPGEEANLNILMDPGSNQVNSVKLTIKFDATKFSTTAEDFALDPSSQLEIINGPITGDGSFSVVLSTGTDPTVVIDEAIQIGALNLNVLETATTGTTNVTFEYAQSEVRLVGENLPDENLLSSAVPATINIEAVCQPNVATCSWDALEGATTYRYKIIQVTPDEEIIIDEGTTAETTVEFESEAGQSYRCEVSAENICGGVGESESATNICPLPSVSPSPGSSPTPGPSNTPTPSPSSTPTPTIPQGGIETPTPTTPPSSSPTPTTEIVASPSPTAIPTLPPTGSPMVIGGIIGGVLIIIGGILLLVL